MTERPTLAVGLMSGTSLDGVDAALVRFDGPTRATLLDFVTRPYTDDERAEIRSAFNGSTAPALARLRGPKVVHTLHPVRPLRGSEARMRGGIDVKMLC